MEFLNLTGQILAEAFFMFWATLWALILGFVLSGIVQSFVSRDDMQKLMGDHKPKTIVRSSLLGIASSSCSYAATALAKSLFQRGADFTAAMVFMFASTNLVIELGIVLWLLLGWQFAVAEFVGGAIMIALFWLLAPRIFPAKQIEAARQRVNARSAADAHDHGAMAAAELSALPLNERLKSRAGWVAAASYTISDLKMLRRELLIGYLVAGVLTVVVPASIYAAVFFQGHGFWTDLENVIVGPFLAFVSFVCSIGSVPLAAALFQGGFGFGGTVAFIFADLIALPLVLIYGKFYGWRLALRLFFSFWAVMSAAGLAVDYLFLATGIPTPEPPAQIVPMRFEWNYTTFLNIVFLILGIAVYLVYRNRSHLVTDTKYATDLVCGMQVETAHAPATLQHAGNTYYFCSDHCQERFAADPDRFIAKAATHP